MGSHGGFLSRGKAGRNLPSSLPYPAALKKAGRRLRSPSARLGGTEGPLHSPSSPSCAHTGSFVPWRLPLALEGTRTFSGSDSKQFQPQPVGGRALGGLEGRCQVARRPRGACLGARTWARAELCWAVLAAPRVQSE